MIKFEIDDSFCLSLLEIKDADKLYELINRNRDHIGEWLKFPSVTLKVDDSISFIERIQVRYEKREGFWLGIWNGNELAGSIGFTYIDQENKKTEIGYWIGKEYEGKGIIIKSLKELINYAFVDLKLNKIEIGVATENTKSRSIPEKLGFMREGEIRDYEYLNGRFHNRIIYGLKSEEWRTN